MDAIAYQITSLNVYSGADQRKHESFASLALVREIHRGPVTSPHKGSITREMVWFDDVIMTIKQMTQYQAMQTKYHGRMS